ncbi:hypothetical protein C2S52_011748 [Perilla frutescens var. hirtella]|nr:hypothetical protein C2S52_011748 [Perilla frutescens var. hirtella]
MSKPNGPKLSLKVMINKQKSKVLFAEANNDFVDVLLSFLTLPLGKIVKILENHYGNKALHVGSLNTLYAGLYHLDSSQFFVGGAKQMFLNPRSAFEAECSRLVLDITDSQPTKYFVCQDSKCSNRSPVGNICMYSDIAVCICGKPLNRETFEWDASPAHDADYGVFTRISSSFVISDDLRVVPVVSGFQQTPAVNGVLQMLTNLGITDTQGAERRSLSLGFDDIMDLLKFSLISATPLTDLIMKNGEKSYAAAKPEPGILLHHIKKGVANSRKMVLKVRLEKSTNKFLFAEATNEFLEFVFSFLTVPLGGVEFLLGGNTCLKSIDNLYKSVTDLIGDEYFRYPHIKEKLINSKLGHGYINENDDDQLLPLSEEGPPKLYNEVGSLIRSFKWGRGQGNHVKEQTTCFVTDDLTVTASLATTISILNSLGIALSDVKEMELDIGLEEALSILKASLTSKTALTDSLINPMINKPPELLRKPKQER